MDCCLLSAEEVGQLRHYGILPNHENHRHVDHQVAIDGLKDESMELVEGKHGRNYLTMSRLYYLKPVESGPSGIPVIQRVISNHLKHLTPIRF